MLFPSSPPCPLPSNKKFHRLHSLNFSKLSRRGYLCWRNLRRHDRRASANKEEEEEEEQKKIGLCSSRPLDLLNGSFLFNLILFPSFSQLEAPDYEHMVDRGDGFSGDTTALTKIFVGGLAWETRRDTMRRYFEQFGEILEAVVISDKNTGRSKGYGFVTFRDPESAKRACEDRFPVIDGRRANCNLASLGARKNRPIATSVQGTERFSQKQPPAAAAAGASSSSFDGHSTYVHQTIPHGSYPYSYGYYPGYSQDFFLMGYYGVPGRHQQQLPPYYHSPGSGMASHGLYLNCYPYYAQPGPSSQYLKSVQYPFLFQQFHNTRSMIPSSALPLPISTARVVNVTAAVEPGLEGNVSEQKSSA